jgi:hypothetical protein
MIHSGSDGLPQAGPTAVVPEPFPRGEAQPTETIGDELKAPKANGFTEGKAITRQVLTASSGDECR